MLRARVAAFVLAHMLAISGAASGQITKAYEQEPPTTWEYMGEIEISAYNVYEGGGENYGTASGMDPVAWYTVATSSTIPFGTVLYIEDVGEVIVADRGGASIESGERIDLFVGCDPCEAWGLKTKSVYIKKE